MTDAMGSGHGDAVVLAKTPTGIGGFDGARGSAPRRGSGRQNADETECHIRMVTDGVMLKLRVRQHGDGRGQS